MPLLKPFYSLRLAARPILRHPLPRPPTSLRLLATKPASSTVDAQMDAIAEQYGIAKDEFEIATEETEKKSLYAAEDRATAREELAKLEKLVEDLGPGEKDEVVRRVGQRVRELKNAVENLNKADTED